MTEAEIQAFMKDIKHDAWRLGRILMRTRQSVAALEAENVLRRGGKAPRREIEFVSQSGQDLLIWSVLRRQTEGFFIEAGAFDGYRYSVTYALEAIGWNGLLVEAIPERAAQCVQRRPNSRVVNAALSAEGQTGSAQLWVMEDAYGGMLSYTDNTPKQHTEKFRDSKRTQVSVPRATLNSLLADHQGEIDVVVLDLEGDEMVALNGFDLSRYRPRLMFIEDTSGQGPVVHDYVSRHGYLSIGRAADDRIYVRQDQTDVIEEMKWLMLSA